jgi:PKD repeat protein
MRLPVLYLSKSYVSVLLGTVVFLLLSITRLSAQPANDSCLQALQIFPPLLVGQSYSYQGHNIGANPELGSGIFDDCTPGGLFSGFGADVWYRFIAPGDVCMSITINGLAEPQINVIEAGTCFSGLEILCTSGSAGTVTGSVELQAGQSYLLRVSGGSQSDQGSFNISLTGITCDAEDLDPYDPCLVADKLELSPLPGQGNTYQPGQEVTMCYTVSGWQYEEQNWLHAISLDIGPGWDLSSLQPQFDFICNSNPNGQWNWYDFWISCTTGNLFGPGFAFESFVQGSCPYGNQFDDDPGTNWGDIGPGCSVAENDPSWKFCWTITVADCSDNENTDLSIGITALSDGASGSWDFPVCGFEVDETIMLKADCSEFNCMPMIAIVEGQSVSCFNEMDGSFDVYPFSSPNETYNVYLYTLEDILLDAAIGVSLPYSYPSVLDTGYYGILVELPGAQEQGYCNEGVIDIIHIQPAFDIFISTTHNCSPDSVQLRASTWPNQSVISYEWSGPNGFTSTDAQPYITQEGTYHVSVSTANCTREASMYIELPDQYISLLIDYWLNVPCADNRLYLYTSDANDNINSYQWTDNATGNALSPSASPIPGSLLWDFGVISSDLDLSLVVISDQGCTDTLFFTVEYYEAPPLNYESSITACQNNDVEINLVENPEIAQVLWLDNNSYESPRIFSNLSPGEILKVPVLITYSNTCEIQDTVSITAPGVNITASDTIACIGNTITIESSPANSYLWSTGETSPSITFTPTTGGDYSFAVTVTDIYDCQRTDNIVINVPNLAEASFTYQVNGNTVFFQPLIPEAIEDTYTWNFGDNTSSSEYAPFHTYSGQDSVVIEFIVNTRCGTDVETQTIYFNLPPTANFTGHLNAGCAPLSVIFNNESTNAIAYFWEFPGGTPATSMAVNPTVTYMEAGVYSVSLFVYNQNGFAFLNENDYIVVGAPPTGSFDFTADFLTVDFIATTEDADSLSWDFGDGNSSSLSNPQHVYPAEGQYEVVLTLFNECGSTQVNQLITVEQLLPPLVDFSAQGDTEGCAPLSITFINQSSGADSYLWNFPGGNPASSTEVNPTVVYEQPGIFNVELIAFNAAGSSALVGSEFVTVGAPPTGSFDFTTDFLTVDFMATTENTDSLSWDFGDGNSSSLSNPQHVYPAEGQYEVVLTLFNECGSTQVNQLVTVEQLLPPLVSFSAQGDTEGCAPISITFINQSSGADNYLWNFPGGNPASSTEVNPTVVYEQPGIFNVELIAFNAAGSSALVGSEFVTVGAPPTGSFDFTTDFLTVDFMATTENADSLIWDFGDGNSSSLSNPQHVYPAEGQYEVVLTLFNECGSVQVNQLVTVEQLLPPLVSFSAQGDTEGCAPISITFINQSSGADNYLWNFPVAIPLLLPK